MQQLLCRALFVGAVVSGLVTKLPQPRAEEPPPVYGKIAVDAPTDTSEAIGSPLRFFRYGTLISDITGTDQFLITDDTFESVDSTESATAISPLSFSPDGRRIALSAWQGGDRIYIADYHQSEFTWVTPGLTELREGNSGTYYLHRLVVWSPDNECLALSTSLNDRQNLISVFEDDSLRTLCTFDEDDAVMLDGSMEWSRDGTALLVAPYLGAKSWQLIRIPVHEEGSWEVVLTADHPIGSMAWDSSHDMMAFRVGSSLWLYDDQSALEIYTAPWFIDSISWSLDGDRLALIGADEQMLIIRKDGRDPWRVTDGIESRWRIPNVEWVDGQRFGFILVTSKPESTMLYTGDADTKKVKPMPCGDIACSRVQRYRDGLLYFKVIGYGPWVERQIHGTFDSGGREREVKLGLFSWNMSHSKSVRVSERTFVTGEDESGFGAYYYPVYWVPSP